jgi:preprotein translocase subunit SecF
MLELIKPGTNFDFVGLKWYALGISGVVTLVSLVFLLVNGLNFGVDFAGGTVIEVRFSQDVSIGDVRAALAKQGFRDAEIKTFGSPRDILIATESSTGKLEGLQAEVEAGLASLYKPGSYSIERVEMVGPKVGADLREKGLLAVILSVILMLVYIGVRFEFKFGVGAVVAMVHDVIFTLGIVALTGRKFNLPMLAAVLTIIGYSVNDTVVIFDRIREDLKKVTKKPIEEIVNLAVNETLSRTLLTGLSTLMALAALFTLGGETLRDFAFTMIVGIVIGTYSSIYIASPVVIFWKGKGIHPKG